MVCKINNQFLDIILSVSLSILALPMKIVLNKSTTEFTECLFAFKNV